MVKIGLGKIYKIASFQTDKIYIGSTFGDLNRRLRQHCISYNRYMDNKYKFITSYKILDYDDFYIELISEHENISKVDLHKIEGAEISQNNCVNNNIPGRSRKEAIALSNFKRKDDIKKYHDSHKDAIKAHKKKYVDTHKDQLREKQRAYREKKKSTQQ